MKSKSSEKNRVVITGMGMVSSVGYTALSSSLAVLAGMMNFQCHERVMVNDDEYGTVLKGAAIARVPDNFVPPWIQGVERALILMKPAIKEAVSGLPPQMLNKVIYEIDSMMDRGSGEIMKQLLEDLPCTPKKSRNIEARQNNLFGRCQGFENIIKAVAELEQGKHEMVLEGSVDSLIEEDLLNQLAEDGRLIDGANPEGIVAGEASGALLLETEAHARARGAKVYAGIRSWGKAQEPHPWTGPTASAASGITDAFLEALEKADESDGIEMIINDLNGEHARSLEWSLAQVRLFPNGPTIMHPADCLGDCGTAMGIAMAVLALNIMLMKREPPQCIALSVSDDAGARRVLVLERGDNLDRSEIVKGFSENKQTLSGT